MTRSIPIPRTLGALVASGLIAIGFAACGTSSQLVNQWRDPSYSYHPMRSVLVLGMMRDPVRRRMWEDRLAAELNKKGVEALPSYHDFPAAVPDTDQIAGLVQNRGFDGVIVTTPLPTQTHTQYVPGYVETVPVTRYSRWRQAYVTYYGDVYRPGYTETEQVVRYRTDVWDAAQDGQMIWSGTSEVFDPSSERSVDREVSRMIVPELVKQRIVRA